MAKKAILIQCIDPRLNGGETLNLVSSKLGYNPEDVYVLREPGPAALLAGDRKILSPAEESVARATLLNTLAWIASTSHVADVVIAAHTGGCAGESGRDLEDPALTYSHLIDAMNDVYFLQEYTTTRFSMVVQKIEDGVTTPSFWTTVQLEEKIRELYS